MSATRESARDIVWLMERWPLDPEDEASRQRLGADAADHREQEENVQLILAGDWRRPTTGHTPAKIPRDYQLTAVELLRARGVQLLTDEVGLGKTFTGLLNLTDPEASPALVVAPTHLPRRWAKELEDAFPWLTYEIGKKTSPSARVAAGEFRDVTIISYSKLAGWAPYLAGHMRTVVFDEAQELRHGENTDKGKAAAQVTEHAAFVTGATATPVYNYGGELFNIVDILRKGELGTREEFTREWGAEFSNGRMRVKDPAALGAHLRDTGLMIGRTRKQVGRELPKTVKNVHTIDVDPTALEEVAKDARRLAELILSSTATRKEKFEASGEIDWKIRQATGVAKAPFVAEFVRMLLSSEDRVVVWGWHREVYDILMEALADFHPRLYTGTESPKQKADAEDAFTAPLKGDGTDCRILIMSLRSGAGIDGLQMVSRVGVFGELDWSPQVHEQAIGRLRRDGMGEDPAVVYFLTSDEGSDPALMDVLQIKRQQAEPIVSPDGKLLTNSTTDPHRARRLAEQILGITPDSHTTNEGATTHG
ncbi:SNF2-related protein [Marisediminicola sp. LYQ134]|uniref:SNF2-related protein n=1 Tax=Marisediminicola sp. LYQ134 TaxID=3391061 RepID=UPI0039838687